MTDGERGGYTTRAILGLRDERTAQRAKAAGWCVATRTDAETLLSDWEAGRLHLLCWPADRIAEPVIARSPVVERRSPGRLMPSRIEALLADALAADDEAVLIMLALSRLDIANAAHGRASVDRVLADVHRRVTNIVQETLGDDVVIEQPGRAEIVLAARCPPDRAQVAAAALDIALAEPFVIDGVETRLGFRLGVAAAEAGDTVVTLAGRAEGAIAHDPALPPVETLAVDLHHALGRDEIDLRFQPQVATRSGRIVGVEALVRWAHPTLGPLGAETLLATATRAGLAMALSDRIQTLVLDRAGRWPCSLADLRVSLNLEAADLARPGFAGLFLDRVQRSGFPVDRLTVEVTETSLIRDLDTVALVLAELREAGCRVAIDDFGTGYSSLAYLQQLPLDYLKIDKALVDDIDGSPRDRVVVNAVIAMAHGLGLEVIAEGVEREAQRALLASAGCATYQGYLTAGALDEPALVALMEENR